MGGGGPGEVASVSDRPPGCRSRTCKPATCWVFGDGTLWCFGSRDAKTLRCDTISVCFWKGNGKRAGGDFLITKAEAAMIANGLTQVIAQQLRSPGGPHCAICSDKKRCKVAWGNER